MKSITFFLIIQLFSVLVFISCRDIFGDRTQPESIIQSPPDASYIYVSSPTHGTIYNTGDTLNIRWKAPTINTLDIQLYRKSEYKFTITENLENTGRFDWVIPYNIPISNHYVVKIIYHNKKEVFEYSGRFGIQ